MLVNRACVGKGPRWQLVSSGEQNCPSTVQEVPLVTLWPLLAHVHRTVSPADILSVSGTNAKPWPTVTSKVWLLTLWHAVGNWLSVLVDNLDRFARLRRRSRTPVRSRP